MYEPKSSLTMDNAAPALEAGLAAIAAGQTEIDLSGLVQVDSAAVATLLAWQRAAQAKGVAIRFNHLPATLESLVHLYGVHDLLAE